MFSLDERMRKIVLSYGNTFSVEVKLSADQPFTAVDYALLTVRDKLDKALFVQAYSLENSGFSFAMNNEESEKIPPGQYYWDFSVYRNARLEEGRPVDGEEVITPFAMAAFQVQDIASKESREGGGP